MKNYLILINIGPVQDFIATARRSRDLWFGSWFLSEISKTAACAIGEKNLIFPQATEEQLNPNTNFNVANKILGIVKLEDDDGLVEFIRQSVKEALDKNLNDSINRFFGNIKKDFNRDLAERQIKDLIEFYWTAVEFDGTDKTYPEAHRKVEYLAAARKNTRDFAQIFLKDNEKNLPKSSLDGKRESVIPERLYSKSQDAHEDLRAKELYENFRIRDKERLCGVGLFKRLGSEVKNRFLGTPEIAALPFLRGLEVRDDTEKINSSFQNFIGKLNELAKVKENFGNPKNKLIPFRQGFDGEIIFESRLRDNFAGEDLITAKEALKDLFEEIPLKQSDISPYYAILLADGDNMGKVIEAQLKANEPIKRHRELSKALSEFAGKVPNIVENHDGSPVYAGGDDVLAFVPLHTVLKCADELQQTFYNDLKEFKYEADKSPTLSVGIAVAHFMEPLSDTLELARTAEKAAKSVNGKNGLAIIVDKRSGTSRIIKGKFTETYNRLRKLIELDREKEVSHQLGYELRDLSLRLEFDENQLTPKTREKFEKIKELEMKRIIAGKLDRMGKRAMSETKREDNLRAIYDSALQTNSAAIIADELITAQIFADAEKTAGITYKSEENENE